MNQKAVLGTALSLWLGTIQAPILQAQTDPDSYITLSSQTKTWSLESSSPLPTTTAAVPSILVLPNGNIRLFHCSGGAGMQSATSTDGGKTFTPDAGTRLMGTCDGTFIYLANGLFRLLIEERVGATMTKSQVVSYISSDGLTFTKESGVRYTGSSTDAGFTGVINVIKLPDGRHRIYYIGDLTSPPQGDGVRTAVSSDEGVTWTPERTTNLLPSGYVDPYVVKLSNGGYRMYYRIAPQAQNPDKGIAYADSADGASFTHVGLVLRDRELADPAVVKLPDGSARMFLGYNDNRLRSATAPAVTELHFAQIGNGLGFTADTVFTNPSTTATANARMEFFDDNGAALSPGILGSTSKSTVDFTVPPLGTATFSTDGAGALVVGSAFVASENSLAGVVRFRIPEIGIAGVGESQPMSGFIVPVRRKAGGINTGVAVRNPETKAVSLTLTLRNKSGAAVTNGTKSITSFAARGHFAQFIHELFPGASTDDFEGTLVVQATGGKVAATALELGTSAGEFTTLPVTALK
ncbi:MAG: exo-alpha-sialidase [Acidobacteria bacterium]|nr:exo-alpha-sialidase [Acidobacteriota bacterium]